MTVAIEYSWAEAIRKNVYQMGILIALFSLAVFGYQSWYSNSSEKVDSLANDYHLSSTFHYLKAMEELRYMQLQASNEIANAPSKTIPIQPIVSQFYAMGQYIISQQILAGLELESNFTDSRFDRLSLKLKQQLKSFTDSKYGLLPKNFKLGHMPTNTNSLQRTLNQLVRLHTIAYNELLKVEEALKTQQTVTFSFLLLGLLLIGTLIARRGLGAINKIISEQQMYESKIEHQAHFDSLTNLPNRFLSLDRLNQLITEAQRIETMVVIMFLDLDHFKKINDTLGHDMGDKLLIEASQRLRSAIRPGDTVGRLGGDEFIIIGKVDETKNARVIAQNLIQKMSDPFYIGDRKMLLGASIGISIYPKDAIRPIDLLRNADSAMYHSKSLGRSTYSFFTDKMNIESIRQLNVEEQMHGALERCELSVFYQPKIDLASDTIMGAEALLRWHNPLLGNVSPEEFIPIAEQTGLILAMGKFVLTEALRTTARWHQLRDPYFTIAVNLSPRQFRDPLLVSQIKKNLKQHGVACRYLELEITEGVVLGEDNKVDQALNELSSSGISIAMDDFGTDYSSLSYLRRYPFDVVKIDRSFINDIDTSIKGRELIIAAISMAHGLKLKVVAEGVETAQQLAYLKQHGCDYAQGYYFSPAVAEEELIDIFEHSRPHNQNGLGRDSISDCSSPQ